MTDALLTLDMAGKRLSLSRATLYRMSDAGEIALVKRGARTMVRESEVTRIVDAARPFKAPPTNVQAAMAAAQPALTKWQRVSANLSSKISMIELESALKLCAYPPVTNGG
ncbi:MAG: helix-turn-helix domain-containing protein [Proteobacteria bacterium]|nr:helix-turn-helix domain-containing protein [Pseudomonadota bacterium]